MAGLAAAAERLRAQVADAGMAEAEPPASGLSAPGTSSATPGTALITASPASPAVRLPTGRGRPAWLASVIAQLERSDPAAAAEFLLALLPIQGGLLAGPACYDVAVDGAAPVRVTLAGGRADLRPAPAQAGEGADFRVAGSPTALAPLVAGGVRRPVRIPVALRVTGRRRRLRRILRGLRSPVLVGDLRGAQAAVDPGLVLRALSVAVEPEWTSGLRFVVAFELTGEGRSWRVEVADAVLTLDERAADEEPRERPTATVRTSADGLLAFIAGVPAGAAPDVDIEGNRHAVTFLLGWWDRVQGLPARPA